MSSFATPLFTNETLNIIVVSIALCHNIGLLLFHIITIIRSSKDETGKKLHRTQYLSVFSILMMTIFPVAVLCLYLMDMHKIQPGIHLHCNLQIQIGIISYLLSKFALYILLLERLFIIFRNSEYKLNVYLVYIIRFIIVGLFIFAMILILITNLSKFDSNKNLCLPNIPMQLKGYFLCIDLSVSMFVLVLFSRKLLLLSLNMSNNIPSNSHIKKIHPSQFSRSMSVSSLRIVSENVDKTLLKVMRKTNLLGIIAVLTTQLSIVMSTLFTGNFWSMIDSMVNCWCIILMFHSYNKLFDCLCQWLLCLISDQCLTLCACYFKHCFSKNDIEEIEINMNNNETVRIGTSTPETNSNNGSATSVNTLKINGIHHIHVSSNTVDDIYEDVITPQTKTPQTGLDNVEYVANEIEEKDKNKCKQDCIEIPNCSQEIYTYHRNSTHL